MENTFVLGINFKSAGIDIRSAFSISPDKQMACYKLAKALGYSDFVVLSTCNRTEIYGKGPLGEAEAIIIEVCNQSVDLFEAYKFVKTGQEAVTHIFQVASGLDSQILGDYEVLGQFKNACKLSKECELLGSVFERMSQICIQASKEIKTRTDLSKGTVSASYAAIEILKEKIGPSKPAKCLLIGTGKFGNNISKNIKHYLPEFELTISNRTYLTAMEIASEHGFGLLPFENIDEEIRNFDVIILSTTAEKYIINPENLIDAQSKLILDLSIPQTVHPDCKIIENVEILDIDSISAILDKSFENRKTYLPVANEIIKNHIGKFFDWSNFYKKRNQIVVLKTMLKEASINCPHLAKMDEASKEEMINKAVQAFVVNLRENKIIQFEPEKIVNTFMNYAQAH